MLTTENHNNIINILYYTVIKSKIYNCFRKFLKKFRRFLSVGR